MILIIVSTARFLNFTIINLAVKSISLFPKNIQLRLPPPPNIYSTMKYTTVPVMRYRTEWILFLI